jgi:molybdate transport system regulatory protein
MTPRAVIKIDFGTGDRLGPGKARLLECIVETGSISAAARQMEMSYRRAWLLIDELNGLFGKPVVETTAGGSGGGGARVTEFGRNVIVVFRSLERQADTLAKSSMAQLT